MAVVIVRLPKTVFADGQDEIEVLFRSQGDDIPGVDVRPVVVFGTSVWTPLGVVGGSMVVRER